MRVSLISFTFLCLVFYSSLGFTLSTVEVVNYSGTDGYTDFDVYRAFDGNLDYTQGKYHVTLHSETPAVVTFNTAVHVSSPTVRIRLVYGPDREMLL